MYRYIQILCIGGIALLINACVSTSTSETHFYTLSQPLVQNKTIEHHTSIMSHDEWITVSVQVPEHFRRPQLVLNRPDGAGVMLLEQERWVSAFDDELKDAIVSGLHQQLFINADGNQGSSIYQLKVSLLQMDTVVNDHVAANFHWTITPKNQASNDNQVQRKSCDFRTSTQITDGVQGAVKGTQVVVQDLINAIINTIKMYGADKAVAC